MARGSRFAWAGIASPVVLAATTVAVAAGRPEYSHVHQTLSELGTVGRAGAAWMNAGGIVPAGILVSLAAVGLRRATGDGRYAGACAWALGAAGICFVGAGLSPWVGGPGDLVSPGSRLHLAFAASGFFLLGLAPLLFGLYARRAAVRWSVPSFIAAAGVWGCSAVQAPMAYAGACQRAALAFFYSWLVALSIRSLLQSPAGRDAA